MKPSRINVNEISNSSYKKVILEELEKNGAVWIRSAFNGTIEDFERCSTSVISDLTFYQGGSSLREELTKKTYTASYYPPFMTLPVHHELAYTSNMPRLIAFGCVKKATHGGQTPIADGIALLNDLPKELVTKIKDKGLLYIRKLNAEDNEYFRGWKSTFGTDNKEEVLKLSEEGGNTSRWIGDVLEVTHHRSGIISHPDSGQDSWISQITAYHPSVIEYVFRKTPQEYLAAAGINASTTPEMQSDCRFGDGTPLTKEDIYAIWEAYDKHTYICDLSEGDFLLLDNLWVGHGRLPFKGDRLVTVSMGNY